MSDSTKMPDNTWVINLAWGNYITVNPDIELADDEMTYFIDRGKNDLRDIENDMYDASDMYGPFILMGEIIYNRELDIAYVYDGNADEVFANLA